MMNDDRPIGAEDGEANAENGSAPASDLETQLADARARADENYDKFLLARVDFENYKKRTERTFAERVSYEQRKMLRAFLPVLDNLERALSFENGAGEGVLGGLQQTLKGFENVLTMEGVKPIEVKGRPFDPSVAEAIATQSAQGVDDDTVIEEVEKGYRVGEEILRPAKVIVAKNSSDA